jgi:hypothetical protein
MLNREYKDTVFAFLFKEPKALRSLYGAISGVEIDPSLPIELNTLENVVFSGIRNDVSFLLGQKLIVLYEHQSTKNPNMPIRMLLYVAWLYDKLIDKPKIHGTKPVPIPRPEFYVFYNGIDEKDVPDVSTMKLSDAFIKNDITDSKINLDLTVTVYNINYDQKNKKELLEKCDELSGYSVFISKAREFENESLTKEEAVKKAIKYCIENNILKEFFTKHELEVVDMLLAEITLEDVKKVMKEEGREEGKEEGILLGKKEERSKILSLIKQGYSVDEIEQMSMN